VDCFFIFKLVKLKNMSKFIKIFNKKVIFIFIIVLISLSAGLFFWWKNREIKGSPADYTIKQTAAGKIVENKKAGLILKVPEGWTAEKMDIEEGAINFYSQNIKINLKENKVILPIEDGCLIQANIVYEQMNFEQIKTDAKVNHTILGVESDDFEEITINNYKALKDTFDLTKYGPGIGIYIPIGDKGYAFYLHWGSSDKEDCIQEFDKFLETVSIK